MPGLHITDHQMRFYKNCRQTHDAAIAAAKFGFSKATGYRIEDDPMIRGCPRRRKRRAIDGGLLRLILIALWRSLAVHHGLKSAS